LLVLFQLGEIAVFIFIVTLGRSIFVYIYYIC
jgi:hypothetical protein